MISVAMNDGVNMKILPEMALTYDDVLAGAAIFRCGLAAHAFHQILFDEKDRTADPDRVCEYGCGDRK